MHFVFFVSCFRFCLFDVLCHTVCFSFVYVLLACFICSACLLCLSVLFATLSGVHAIWSQFYSTLMHDHLMLWIQHLEPLPFSKKAVYVSKLCSVLQAMYLSSQAHGESCDMCGTAVGPKESSALCLHCIWNAIQRRVKLDAHMRTCHPDHPWTPLSPDHVERFKERGLVQMLIDNPEIQFDSLPSDPPPIVDGPRKKIRKTGASMYSVDCVKFWERIANQLLFLKHRDADTMWSLLIRYNPATKVLMKTLNLSDAI